MSLNPPISKPSFKLSGRNFVVTGGTQGLGLEIARHLKKLGAANIVLVSRSLDRGHTITRELTDDNCQFHHIPADLSQIEDTSSVILRAVALLPTTPAGANVISGVVNAAATTARGNLFTTTASDFDYQMALNVRAPFLISQSAARHMIEQSVRGGSIVNIECSASHGGAPFVMAYSAAKAALVTMTKNNAHELASKGIRVNAVNMGWCFTENEDKHHKDKDPEWVKMADSGVPLGRILRPADVAVIVAFLLSDASVMMTGSVLDVHPDFPHGMLSLLDEDVR